MTTQYERDVCKTGDCAVNKIKLNVRFIYKSYNSSLGV